MRVLLALLLLAPGLVLARVELCDPACWAARSGYSHPLSEPVPNGYDSYGSGFRSDFGKPPFGTGPRRPLPDMRIRKPEVVCTNTRDVNGLIIETVCRER